MRDFTPLLRIEISQKDGTDELHLHVWETTEIGPDGTRTEGLLTQDRLLLQKVPRRKGRRRS